MDTLEQGPNLGATDGRKRCDSERKPTQGFITVQTCLMGVFLGHENAGRSGNPVFSSPYVRQVEQQRRQSDRCLCLDLKFILLEEPERV